MKPFVVFLLSRSRLAINFTLALLSLFFIPGSNFYTNLKLPDYHPVVRAIDYSLEPISDYPVNITGTTAPYLSAQSALVVDTSTKSILYAKNPDRKLFPASTTKIVTALVALDQYDLNETVTIKEPYSIGQVMDLEAGETITVENLLYGLLVQSGNDAAVALAQHHPQGETAFIAAMNQKVADLNLTDTQFQNSIGIDEHGHYTTVHDLSLIAAEAMKHSVFRKIVGTKNITITDTQNTISHDLETINELLGVVPGLSGIKTGWTELAGECLVTYTTRNGQVLIVTVLGSLDRFGESTSLIDWAFTNHQWQALATTRL